MQRPGEHPIAAAAWRGASLLAAACLLSACAASGTVRPEQTEVRGAHGFSITEEVHVSPEVRAGFQRAVELLEQGQHEEGIALLVGVTEAAPRVTAAHIDLGIAYGRVDDLERAKASLERALELNPRHPVAHNELGIVQRRTGRFDDARKSYERALAVYPEFHFARKNLAILCDVYLGDAACALEHYRLYTEAVPDDKAAAMWAADIRKRRAE